MLSILPLKYSNNNNEGSGFKQKSIHNYVDLAKEVISTRAVVNFLSQEASKIKISMDSSVPGFLFLGSLKCFLCNMQNRQEFIRNIPFLSHWKSNDLDINLFT